MPEITVIPARKTQSAVRTAAYARVSSDSEDQLNSFSAQIEHYAELLQNKPDVIFVDLYADEGISGVSTENRAEFNRMISDCRKGKIDRILTKSISRFARNTRDCLEAIRELKSMSVSVYFEKENLDNDKMTSEMLLTLYSQFAQEESISISKNVRMGVKKRMEDGTFIAGRAPFGYRLENGELVIDEDKAEIVRKIFADYLSGDSERTISERYGVKLSTVKSVLKNEKYTGDSIFHKYYTTDTLPFRCVQNKGEHEMYYVPETHSAIISKEDFDKTQQLLEQKGASHNGKTTSSHPLRKMIYCGECGTLYKRKEHSGKVYWVCRNHDDSALNCSAKQVPESEFYRAFIVMFNKLEAAHKDILPSLIRTLETISDIKVSDDPRISELRKQAADLKKQQHAIIQLKAAGAVDEVYCAERTRKFDGEMLSLTRRIRALTGNDQDDKALDELRELEKILESTEQLSDFEEELFAEIVEKITVLSDNEIRFILTGGLEFDEKICRKGR